MEIRKAAIHDCDQLTQLRIDMRNEREHPCSGDFQNTFYHSTFQYFTENIESGNFIAYIAVEKDEIIATSGLCFCFAPPTYKVPDGKIAYIMNMYTKPAYRKRGIAAKLLDCIVQEAICRDCTEILLNASDMGKPIYQKYGFTEVENEMVYYAEQSVRE